MAGVGIYLRQAREQLGYSLEEMNRITNIHTEYLYALENDQFDQLPSPFYARAFLRTYAKSLGLEVQPVLELYERLTQSTASTGQFKGYEPARQHSAFPERAESAGRSHSSRHLPAPNHTAIRQRSVLSPELQATQRMTPVSNTTNPAPAQNSFPNLPKPDLSAQTLSPRRVALEAKQALANVEAKMSRRAKKFPGVVIAAAVGALILAGGIYYFAFADKADQISSGGPQQTSEIDTSVNANGQNTPLLEQGETPEKEYDGQLYTISNVDKLKVVLKAKDGESRVTYAPTPGDPHKELTLRVGQELELDTAGKDHIWFRLSIPSNVDILVNDQQISTDAQDTEKSYRVQLKK